MHVYFVWNVLSHLFTWWSSYILLHNELPANLVTWNSNHFIIYLMIMWVRNSSKTQLARMTLPLVLTEIIWRYSTGNWTCLESLKQNHSYIWHLDEYDWKAGLSWGCQPECPHAVFPALQPQGNGLIEKLRAPRDCSPGRWYMPYDLTSKVLEHHFCHMLLVKQVTKANLDLSWS